MNVIVTGRHLQISDKFRDTVNAKSKRIESIAPDAQRVEIVVAREGNPRLADSASKVEITVYASGDVVRAEASSADQFSALDLALDKLTLRLRRMRDRRKDHRRGHFDVPESLPQVEAEAEAEALAGEEPTDLPDRDTELHADLDPGQSVEVRVGDTPVVIRRKLHIAEPMSIDEALYEMELIGHDFFLFVNKENNRPSVVYRRHGWSYGVFEIDTAENVAKSAK